MEPTEETRRRRGGGNCCEGGETHCCGAGHGAGRDAPSREHAGEEVRRDGEPGGGQKRSVRLPPSKSELPFAVKPARFSTTRPSIMERLQQSNEMFSIDMFSDLRSDAAAFGGGWEEGEEEEVEVTQAPPAPHHQHHLSCGHIAIAHEATDGTAHLGFVVNDGTVECFTVGERPIKLQDLCIKATEGGEGLIFHRKNEKCLTSEYSAAASSSTSPEGFSEVSSAASGTSANTTTGHMPTTAHSHRTSPVMGGGEQHVDEGDDDSCCKDAQILKLTRVEESDGRSCPIAFAEYVSPQPHLLPSVAVVVPSTIASDHGIHDKNDTCNHAKTTQTVQHGDHLDDLLEDEEGNFILHHRTRDNRCEEHGKLYRVRKPAPADNTWASLFVTDLKARYCFHLATRKPGLSRVALAVRGLCCEAEVPEVSALLEGVEALDSYEVRPREQDVVITFPSGSTGVVEESLRALRAGGFEAHFKTTLSSGGITSPSASLRGSTRSSRLGSNAGGVVASGAPVVVPGNPTRVDGVPPSSLLTPDYSSSTAGMPSSSASTSVAKVTSEKTRTGPPRKQKSVLSVQGVCCRSEVPLVERIAATIPGVESVFVKIIAKQVVVTHAQDVGPDWDDDAKRRRRMAVAESVASALTRGGFLSKVIDVGGARLPPPTDDNSLALAASLAWSSVTFKQAIIASEEPSSGTTSCDHDEECGCVSTDPHHRHHHRQHEEVTSADVAPVSKSSTSSSSSVLVASQPQKSSSSSLRAALTTRHRHRVNHPPTTLQLWRRRVCECWRQISRFRPALQLATLCWLISWLSYIPDLGDLQYLSVAAVVLAFPRILWKACQSLRRRVMDINLLMSVACVGALGLQDFHEAASVVVIFSLSDWLEYLASQRARRALEAIVALKPDVAIRASDPSRCVPVEEIEVGEELIVRVGDKIPVDGVVIEGGGGLVNEASLTGESAPAERLRGGDALFAGTLNVGNTVMRMRCTAPSEDSAVARLVRLVDEAQQMRSPTEQVVERVASVYTPVVVLLAVLFATIPFAYGDAVGIVWLKRSLTLLVVACPCALVISTPITYVAGLARAAQLGILVKGGVHLETVATAKVMCADKTGTLTTGRFVVEAMDRFAPARPDSPLARISSSRLLRSLKDMVRTSTHPIATAVVAHEGGEEGEDGLESGESLRLIPDSVEFLAGEGLRGGMELVELGGRVEVYFGNVAMVKRLSPTLSSEVETWLAAHTDHSISMMVVGTEATGYEVVMGVAAADAIRPETPEALRGLQAMGIEVHCLTGDNLGSALAMQRTLQSRYGVGLASMRAGLKPADKVEQVMSVKQELAEREKRSSARCLGLSRCCSCSPGSSTRSGGKVLMLGDGVNDAPALSCADCGLVLGATGAPLALETADVGLMDNDLTKLVKLVRLARRTRVKILENVFFSVALKLVTLALAITGIISLGVAIALDVGGMLVVTINGITLLDFAIPRHHSRLAALHEKAKVSRPETV